MFKKYVAFFTAVIFIITMFPIAFIQKAYAYQSNAYFNDVKVGLVSMSSPNITLTLIGDYNLNGQVYKSGAIISLAVSGTSIILNGTAQDQINLIPNNSSNLLTITSGALSNKFRGSFLIKVNNSKILPINIVDIENYLKGVVGYEMSDNFPLESLKAQAVTARNYALSRVGYETAKGYDFDDTSSYQVYKGYDASLSNVINSVDQTRGQVLLYNDTLVETLYSAWHGGVSENSENVWGNTVPYLRSVQDSYENLTWPNGNITLTNSQIQAALITKKYLASTDIFLKLDLNSITKFTSGRIANINIIYRDVTGVTQTKSVTKDNTRTFLSLPSNLYTVTYDAVKTSYTFLGKGNGHGLGMSQIGAKNRAAAGQTYDQILKFYYQNVYLQNLILKATLSSFTQTTNSLIAGGTISFSSAAAAGNGYGYLFKYVVKNGVNVVLTKDYSSNSTLDFVPSTPGSYTATVYVKDKYSISDYDDTKTSSFTVYGSPVLNSFTLSKPSIIIGQDISANVDVQGGSGSFLYKYEVSKDGAVISTRDFLADKQFTYTPNQLGNYNVTAYVKDLLSTKAYDDMKTVSIPVYAQPTMNYTSTQSSTTTGSAVSYNITEVGGSGNAQYKFVVMKDSKLVSDSGYSNNNSFTLIPANAGTYQVTGYLRDVASKNDFDAQKTLNLTVYSPQITTVNASGYFYEGRAVTFNANSTGASSAGLSYRYEVYSNGNLVASNSYSNSNSFTFIPSAAGVYNVKVYGKDGLSTNSYDSLKQFNITINSKPLYIATLPLNSGMTSNDVVALQNALIKLGYSVSSATGYFGSQTSSAVIAFQNNAGIPATGTVGDWTYNSLNSALIQKVGIKNLTF